jgi:hypothetical protein
MILLGTIASCNIFGAAYSVVHGPEQTPAQYSLDKNRPTVVFVDDRANILPRRAMRQQIALAAQNALLKEGVLKNVMDATAALNAAAHETAGEPMDMASLAKAVHAEVMIYVSVDSFVLSSDGQTYQPEARYHVKVIDTTKPNARLWPEEHEGYPLTVNTKPDSTAAPKNAGERAAGLTALAERSGGAVAELFFSHEATEHMKQ